MAWTTKLIERQIYCSLEMAKLLTCVFSISVDRKQAKKPALLGRRVSSKCITLCLGRFRHRTVYRTICRGSSMVRTTHPPESFCESTSCKKQTLFAETVLMFYFLQGHIHNRLLDPWWWRQSPSNTNQEPHLYYLL